MRRWGGGGGRRERESAELGNSDSWGGGGGGEEEIKKSRAAQGSFQPGVGQYTAFHALPTTRKSTEKCLASA